MDFLIYEFVQVIRQLGFDPSFYPTYIVLKGDMTDASVVADYLNERGYYATFEVDSSFSTIYISHLYKSEEGYSSVSEYVPF